LDQTNQKSKVVLHSINDRWARSWSRSLGSQPAGDLADGRLPLLSARPAVTLPAEEHHYPLPDTKLYYLVTEEHTCKLHALPVSPPCHATKLITAI